MDTVTGRLVIKRPGNHYRDAVRAYLIEVDGEERGAVKPGESLALDVTAGSRRVRASIDWTGSPELAVEVRAGEEVGLVVQPAGSAFSALFQLIRPMSYLRLTVEEPS